jgi:hypothetical protein
MEIPGNVTPLETRTSIIWKSPEGIVYSTPKPSAPTTSTDEEIIADIKKFKDYFGDQKVCIILEANPKTSGTPKAQRDLVAESLNSVVKALAIISNSPVTKMVANLFFSLKPPGYPIKMFTEVKEAEEWIRKHL